MLMVISWKLFLLQQEKFILMNNLSGIMAETIITLMTALKVVTFFSSPGSHRSWNSGKSRKFLETIHGNTRDVDEPKSEKKFQIGH